MISTNAATAAITMPRVLPEREGGLGGAEGYGYAAPEGAGACWPAGYGYGAGYEAGC